MKNKAKNTHPPKKKKKTNTTKKGSAPLQTPEERTNQDAQNHRTSMRMTPIPSPGVLCDEGNDLLNRFEDLDVESNSDEGSDMDDIDEYLPRVYNIEEENIPDDGYDVDLMENDGTYETSHVWMYEDLEEELPAPTNLYDGEGPCLRRGIAEKLK